MAERGEQRYELEQDLVFAGVSRTPRDLRIHFQDPLEQRKRAGLDGVGDGHQPAKHRKQGVQYRLVTLLTPPPSVAPLRVSHKVRARMEMD